jgi:carboxylate-amine ligase
LNSPRLDAFMGYGIEIEYAIVDRHHLNCQSIADRLLYQATGITNANSANRGMLAWSNELVSHVIEIKNTRPSAALTYLPSAFQSEVQHINELLEISDAQLMPTAMHPWMDPRNETILWSVGDAGIYRAYERIFDIRTHGWANLQSMHINLPFGDDAQFVRLHAAIRLILPIIPALAASSPIANGENTGFADYRMEVYRTNATAFPSITGTVIPETVYSIDDYQERILQPMYRDIAPHDPQQQLQQEWLNSRGAIARFDRQAIEIRVTDTQECPKADIAVAAAIIAATRTLYDATDPNAEDTALAAQQAIGTDALANIFEHCIIYAEQAHIDDAFYLQLLGYPAERCSANELWRYLIASTMPTEVLHAEFWQNELNTILQQGTLARRILRAIGNDYTHAHLHEVYHRLCGCLRKGTMFI